MGITCGILSLHLILISMNGNVCHVHAKHMEYKHRHYMWNTYFASYINNHHGQCLSCKCIKFQYFHAKCHLPASVNIPVPFNVVP